MPSSPMEWEPTFARVVPSRGQKRPYCFTDEDFEISDDECQLLSSYTPYPKGYMTGGWPASPLAYPIPLYRPKFASRPMLRVGKAKRRCLDPIIAAAAAIPRIPRNIARAVATKVRAAYAQRWSARRQRPASRPTPDVPSVSATCSPPGLKPPVLFTPRYPPFRSTPPKKRPAKSIVPNHWPTVQNSTLDWKDTPARRALLDPATPPRNEPVDVTPPLSHEKQLQRELHAAAQAKAEAERKAEHQRRFVLGMLPQDWEDKVENALKNGTKVYSSSDLARVVPEKGARSIDAWLNDETINGYLNLICNRGNTDLKAGQTPKYHAFNSFFMKTLIDKGDQGPACVTRWAKRAKIGGKKLLDVENIYIPINSAMHWTLLVISPTTKDIRYYDSLGGTGRDFIEKAQAWLKLELNTDSLADWTSGTGVSPRQNNSSDCGVFTVTSAKMLMLGGTAMAYGAHQIPLQRRRIVAELVNGALL